MPLARLRRSISSRAAQDERFKSIVSTVANAVGFDLTHITRKVYWEDCARMIRSLDPSKLDVLEISAGMKWREFGFRSYRTLDFPEHDICDEDFDPGLLSQFDLVIADQVFEHLLWPYRAGRNVLRMLRPGGSFLVMTPFMIRVHEVPTDCTRWTETGMRYFLHECGFDPDSIRTSSWGNATAVKASLVTWGRVGWRRHLPNDPRFPVSVWAMARRPG